VFIINTIISTCLLPNLQHWASLRDSQRSVFACFVRVSWANQRVLRLKIGQGQSTAPWRCCETGCLFGRWRQIHSRRVLHDPPDFPDDSPKNVFGMVTYINLMPLNPQSFKRQESGVALEADSGVESNSALWRFHFDHDHQRPMITSRVPIGGSIEIRA
jgi:hypothetical protein